MCVMVTVIKPLTLYTDASDVAIDAVWWQEGVCKQSSNKA